MKKSLCVLNGLVPLMGREMRYFQYISAAFQRNAVFALFPLYQQLTLTARQVTLLLAYRQHGVCPRNGALLLTLLPEYRQLTLFIRGVAGSCFLHCF
jgi:hypothetical protein